MPSLGHISQKTTQQKAYLTISTSNGEHLVSLQGKLQVDSASLPVTEGGDHLYQVRNLSYLSKEGIIHIFLYPFLLSPVCISNVNIKYHRLKYFKWEGFRCRVSFSIIDTMAGGKETLAVSSSTALGIEPNTGKNQLLSTSLCI